MLAILRGSVRPVCTLVGVAAITAFVAVGVSVPQEYWAMVGGMVAWWFYERSKGKGV